MFEVEEESHCDGICNFRISMVIDSDDMGHPLTSKKSGKPMIKIGMNLKDEAGNTEFISDYIVANQRYKFKMLFAAVNKMEWYVEKGPLKFNPPDLIGLTGKCEVFLDSSNPDYPPRTSLRMYIDPNDTMPPNPMEAPIKPSAFEAVSPPEDPIPF